LQQQVIPIDSDLVNDTSGGQARVQYLLPESEVGNLPRGEQFWRSMAQFDIIRKKCSEWIIVTKMALAMVSGSVSDERAFSAMNFSHEFQP
jgi:hypothetical protein